MAGKRPNGEGSIYSYKGRWYVQGVIGAESVKSSETVRRSGGL